jgi:hypothetical protein
MAKRSRKTAADLINPLMPGARAGPPGDLDPAEQATWTTIVESLPADWFGSGNLPLLKQYCRHIHNADSSEVAPGAEAHRSRLKLLKVLEFAVDRIL